LPVWLGPPKKAVAPVTCRRDTIALVACHRQGLGSLANLVDGEDQRDEWRLAAMAIFSIWNALEACGGGAVEPLCRLLAGAAAPRRLLLTLVSVRDDFLAADPQVVRPGKAPCLGPISIGSKRSWGRQTDRLVPGFGFQALLGVQAHHMYRQTELCLEPVSSSF
jgi:hypothetical protein